MCRFLLGQTAFNTKEMLELTADRHSWKHFEKKILNFLTLIDDAAIMKNYFKHICEKHIFNGY